MKKKDLAVLDQSFNLALTDDDPKDAEPKEKLKALKLLSFLEQCYFIEGKIPSFEDAKEMHLNVDLYKKWMSSRPFRQALSERGVPIPFPGAEGLDPLNRLTDQQWSMIKIYTDLNDRRSIKKRLDDNEISSQEWQAWLADPNFRQALHGYTEQQFIANQHEALVSLMENVKSGDFQAIKFYLEMTDRYHSKGEKGGNLNVGQVVTQIVEILQEEIQDRDILSRVGTRMMGIFAAIKDES